MPNAADDKTPFWKMEGAGNDLVFLDALERPIPDPAETAKALCRRSFGVGADGLMLAEVSETVAAKIRMFNPDGTEDFCGNGMRCAAAWLVLTGHAPEGSVALESPKGFHRAEVAKASPRVCQVSVDLVKPRFAPADVPVDLPVPEALNYDLDVDGQALRVSSVSLGTAHTVVFVDDPPSDEEFLRISPKIETHPAFPERTSVLWVVLAAPERLEMRIWERHVGETLACGTGACAAHAVAHRLGLAGETAEIAAPGGTLRSHWDGQSPARSIGPARCVFRGWLVP